MKRRVVYRTIVLLLFIGSFTGLLFLVDYKLDRKIPDYINLRLNEKEEFDFSLPFEANLKGKDLTVINVNQGKLADDSIHFNFDKPFSVESKQKGSYAINLKLFGLIDYKTIKVNVIDHMEVIPSGEPVGIYIESDGILVLGTSPITGEDGKNYEPAMDVLKSGDYITGINGKKVEDKTELIEKIQQLGSKKLVFEVRRNETMINVSLNAVKTMDGDYKIGTWIRDNTQGIGTLTYVGNDGRFGALGHGITDVDTNLLMEIKEGSLYNAGILDIIKGENGTPGEIVGMIKTSKGNEIGVIKSNTNQGIFGMINHNYCYHSNKSMPIGLKQDIKRGKATILSSVEGKVKEYEIEIEKVEMNTKNASKGLVIRITDEKLLKVTNGIVQGMSGSPIIQDGKVIGAVTHVFIQNSTKGYGTFIENMLKTSE